MDCTILLADADPLLGERMADTLKFYGYQVTVTVNGPGALSMARGLAPDVIILDLMLPEMDGLEVCRQLRRSRNTATTPIIMISTSEDEFDTVVSLEVGADAFLTKPVSHRELLAHIRALLRRSGSFCAPDNPPGRFVFHQLPPSRGELVAGPLLIDLNGRLVTCRGKEVILPRREWELLVYLAQHPGTVLSRDQLLLDIWGKDYRRSERTVDKHVGKLRWKFEQNPRTPRLFLSVFNIGYCFMPGEEVFIPRP